jgi:hypothetical protein
MGVSLQDLLPLQQFVLHSVTNATRRQVHGHGSVTWGGGIFGGSIRAGSLAAVALLAHCMLLPISVRRQVLYSSKLQVLRSLELAL